ncbi:MAG: hypothetical protein V3V91_04815 [Thermoplasmata archaeon]
MVKEGKKSLVSFVSREASPASLFVLWMFLILFALSFLIIVVVSGSDRIESVIVMWELFVLLVIFVIIGWILAVAPLGSREKDEGER